MILRKVFWISFLALSFSCKNEKDIESLEVVRPQLVEKSFKVTLSLVLKQTDDLSLYYTTDNTTDFKIDPIWVNVKGSKNSQEVSFVIENDKTPTQLRLDFGMNPKQEDIVFESISLEYNGKKNEIKGANLGLIFRADETKCTFDNGSGVIKALVKDGVRQNPSLYPHEKILIEEIEKITK